MNIPELCTWLSVCHPVKKNHLSDIQEKGNRKWDEKHKVGIASWRSLYWFFTAPQSMYKLPQSGSVQLYRSCFVDRPVFGWDVTSATTKFVLLSIYLFIYIFILFHFWGRSSSVHFSVSRTTWGSALSVLYNLPCPRPNVQSVFRYCERLLYVYRLCKVDAKWTTTGIVADAYKGDTSTGYFDNKLV